MVRFISITMLFTSKNYNHLSSTIVHITRVNKSTIKAGTSVNKPDVVKMLNLLILKFVLTDPKGISICYSQLGCMSETRCLILF